MIVVRALPAVSLMRVWVQGIDAVAAGAGAGAAVFAGAAAAVAALYA